MIRLKVATTAVFAKVYQDEIWKLHRISRKVLSDRGPQFVSKFIEDLIKVL